MRGPGSNPGPFPFEVGTSARPSTFRCRYELSAAMHPTVKCLFDGRCLLGEGPVWDERARRLWWVDVKAPAIHRLDPEGGEHRSWPAPEPVSAVALREGRGLVAALTSGFAFFDPEGGGFQ